MGGFKRRLMELEAMYGPAWSWNGDWNNPDFYSDLIEGHDEDQVVVVNDVRADLDQNSVENDVLHSNKNQER